MSRTNFFEFITKYFDFFETLFILVLSVSLLLLTKTVAYSQYAVYASLGCLTLLYWLMAIRPFDKKVAGIRIAIRRIVFVAYLMSCLAILASLRFDYEVEPNPLIITSLVFLALAVVLLLVKKYKMKEPEKITANILRCGIFSVILGWLLFMF